MPAARSVIFNIIGRDGASKAFTSASRSAETAATRIDRAAARMGKTGAAIQAAGMKLSKAITLPAVAAAAVSVDQAVKFQKSMTLIQTAGGETAAKAAKIADGIKKIATETGTSLGDLSEGIYTVAKAGSQKWSATGQLTVLKAAAQGAKAEGVDLGTAVNALTSVMMSYHMKASDAVKVENELVVGAGRAKTSMQDYAGSLATVVPIASAAHIKFAQVAGAIATLTQHGTSAQEATQELAHTIRNLQSPNGVAIKSMQQLGLNVVDVQKNLGKRGLTGTINLITDAIEKKLGPDGLVVVDAFKKSQSATADLAVELSKMPPNLQKISKQFESGKMGYQDYRTAVKSLGGAAFEMGMQFISTMGQAKGFNDMLRAGKPAAQTFVGYLKNTLGTATALNTVLQLGGENMGYFTQTTKDVAKAAKTAGGDVLGWSKTQGTLAVKIDKAKASLQVMAVEIGTALIPAVTKVVGWVTKAVQWFENLSDSKKKLIGYGALILVALGPALAIIGRVTRAFATMWAVGAATSRFAAGVMGAERSLATMQSKAYLAGLKVRGMNAAVRGGAGLLIGGAAGFGIAKLTRNSSHANQALGTLASTAAGAAAGFAIGGPLGAALGGAAGLISNVVTNFQQMGSTATSASKEAKRALQEQNAEAETLVQSLAAVNGAYTQQYKQQIAKLIQDKGYTAKAIKLGMNPNDLLKAVLGTGKTYSQLVDESDTLTDKYTANFSSMTFAQRKSMYNQIKQLDLLIAAVQYVGPAALGAEGKYENLERTLNGSILTTAQLGVSYKKLHAALGKTGTQLNQDSTYGMRNTEIVKENVQAISRNATYQLKHGASVRSVAKAYQGQIDTLEHNLLEMGFSRAEVEKLIKKYAQIPKSVRTKVDFDDRGIIGKAESLKSYLQRKFGGAITQKVYLETIAKQGHAHGFASGTGSLPNGVSSVGERGAELAIKHGSRVQILSHSASKAFLAQAGMSAPGFASGTRDSAIAGNHEAAKFGPAPLIDGDVYLMTPQGATPRQMLDELKHALRVERAGGRYRG